MMKNTIKTAVVAVLGMAAIAIPAASFAATATLKNGGVGQVAGNTASFGVAVCNKGSKVVTASVPVTVTVNGASTEVSSAPSIAAGACAYTYVSYASLGMQPGKTYSATVTINGGDTASYTITVPGTQPSQTADVGAQAGGFWAWLSHLFGGK